MFIRKSTLILSFLCLVAMTASPYAKAENFNASQKEELGAIIKEYLMKNPEVIIEAVNEYRSGEEKRAAEDAKKNISKNLAALTAKGLPSVGNENADVVIVEFFDYNCGYCKKAIGDIQSIVKSDDNVRFVFQEMPILGPSSILAAQWAMAAHQQGKYFEYHAELMNFRGNKDTASLEKIAQKLGLDIDKMKEDINSEDVARAITASTDLADDIGIRGTPAFIVGDELFRGYIGREGLLQAIKEQRNKQG